MNKPQPTNSLSTDDARQLAEHLSLVTKSGLPMAPALRAAAEELPNHRLAHAMEMLATIWKQGNRWKPFWHRIRNSCQNICGN